MMASSLRLLCMCACALVWLCMTIAPSTAGRAFLELFESQWIQYSGGREKVPSLWLGELYSPSIFLKCWTTLKPFTAK